MLGVVSLCSFSSTAIFGGREANVRTYFVQGRCKYELLTHSLHSLQTTATSILAEIHNRNIPQQYRDDLLKQIAILEFLSAMMCSSSNTFQQMSSRAWNAWCCLEAGRAALVAGLEKNVNSVFSATHARYCSYWPLSLLDP